MKKEPKNQSRFTEIEDMLATDYQKSKNKPIVNRIKTTPDTFNLKTYSKQTTKNNFKKQTLFSNIKNLFKSLLNKTRLFTK